MDHGSWRGRKEEGKAVSKSAAGFATFNGESMQGGTLHYPRDKNQKNIVSISIFLDIFPLIKLRIDALVK